MTTLPDYIIIGAMKCGTSTLAAQLGAQRGIFMTTPKEPNFFSDRAVYARGLDWYHALFDAAAPGDLRGEASTHYTKQPDYPDVIARLQATGASPRLIYMIRNPLERVISHYIHEWTEGVITSDLGTALNTHSALINYSCYGDQIAPWAEAFGTENILLLSLEALQQDHQAVLDAAGTFLGKENLVWQDNLERVNASSERIRKLPLQDIWINSRIAKALRRALVPQRLRDNIRESLQMRERPTLDPADRARLEARFAQDYDKLKALFPDRPGVDLAYPFLAP